MKFIAFLWPANDFLRALNSNKFIGAIPAALGSLSNIYWLDLADNQLSGQLPVSSGTSPGLDLLTNTKHLQVFWICFMVILLNMVLIGFMIFLFIVLLTVISTKTGYRGPFQRAFSTQTWNWYTCKLILAPCLVSCYLLSDYFDTIWADFLMEIISVVTYHQP